MHLKLKDNNIIASLILSKKQLAIINILPLNTKGQ